MNFGEILAERTFGKGMSVFLVIVAAVSLCVCLMERKKKEGAVKGSVAALAMLVFPTAGYFVLAARMSPYLVDRYIMAVFPFVMLMGACVLTAIACFVQRRTDRKYLLPFVWGVVLVLQIVHLAGYDGSYLYKGYTRQEELSVRYQEYPCICIYEGVGYYENLLEFANYNKTLLVTQEELKNRQEIQSVYELDCVVVLMKNVVDTAQMCDILQQKYGLNMQEELLADGVHGDRVYLFVRE